LRLSLVLFVDARFALPGL